MKVKVRKRSSKRNPAPVVTEQVSKENCYIKEDGSYAILVPKLWFWYYLN